MDLPQWRLRRQLHHARPERALQEWLFERGSLTRKLRAFCTAGFSLQLHSLQHALPRRDEARALELAQGQKALVREVYLLCGQRKAVFARSVIPLSTLRGGTARLARLGHRPLADILFSSRTMTRGAMEFALLGRHQAMHRPAARGFGDDSPLWARRAIFSVDRKKLLVSEVFAPWLAGEAADA